MLSLIIRRVKNDESFSEGGNYEQQDKQKKIMWSRLDHLIPHKPGVLKVGVIINAICIANHTVTGQLHTWQVCLLEKLGSCQLKASSIYNWRKAELPIFRFQLNWMHVFPDEQSIKIITRTLNHLKTFWTWDTS